MAFQQSINAQPAPAREGAFCSANPRSSLLSLAGGLVSGPLGVTIGRFAWADSSGVARNIGGGGNGRIGFVHEDNISLITTWLARSNMTVLPNIELNLFSGGDFWMRFAGGANIGQKVFANFADGSGVAGATGVAPAAGAATGSIAPANPFNTAEPGGLLTVTAGSNIAVGGILTGAGVVSGTQIQSQLSGTPGGVGVYAVSIGQTVASETITDTHGVFTAASGLAGTFAVGDILAGSGVTAGTQITALGTGVGGLGTYIVSPTQTAASTAITSSGAQETAWSVHSYAAAGELAQISTARTI